MHLPKIKMGNKVDRYVPALIAVLVFLGASSFFDASFSVTKDTAAFTEVTLPEIVDPYSNISIIAKSAYVVDLNTREVLFEKNADLQLPLASITKIMTAIVASELNVGEPIIISSESIAQEGDSGLYSQERWKLENLLSLTLLSSSNDGAHAVAKQLGSPIENFYAHMNQKAQELSLLNTYFINETGLDKQVIENGATTTKAGAFGSAKDVVTMLEYGLRMYPEIFEATRLESVSIDSQNNGPHEVLNTHKRTQELPSLLSSKTGYTKIAGGNLVVIIQVGLGHAVGISVLGSTFEGRFDDVYALAWAAAEKIKQ